MTKTEKNVKTGVEEVKEQLSMHVPPKANNSQFVTLTVPKNIPILHDMELWIRDQSTKTFHIGVACMGRADVLPTGRNNYSRLSGYFQTKPLMIYLRIPRYLTVIFILFLKRTIL